MIGETKGVAMPMTVRDVMNRFVVAVEATASFSDVVTAMCRFHVGAVPVVDGDRRVIGMVSDDDLLLKDLDRRPADLIVEGPSRRRERRKASGHRAAQIMSSPAITVTEDTPLRQTACLMHRNGIKELPVVDGETGRITGLVKRSDLIRAFCRPRRTSATTFSKWPRATPGTAPYGSRTGSSTSTATWSGVPSSAP
ncbi:hypothetical protein GCM10027612_75780 [Microbispora bryophytorum subsp. camponoti]